MVPSTQDERGFSRLAGGVLLRPASHAANGGCSMSLFTTFLKDESGATAIEYGLIAAVMVVAIASTIRTMSAPITGAFQRVFDSFF